MFGKNFAKTIKMFLLDGIPNGRLTCELSNWTGKVYKIPRNKIKESANRKELQNTGVYLLFGKSDNDFDKGVIYIGEAENIYTRITQHLSEKDFWNEVLIFISKDENLNKAHIKYLENKFYKLAKEVNRYEIKNSQIPTLPSISESDQAEMEEFLENSKMLVNIFGYKVFENLRQKDKSNKKDLLKLYIKSSREADAVGEQTTDGFVVFKNSKISTSTVNSFPKSFNNLRNKLIKEKIIIENTFTKDYLFSSPSTAAAIVMGKSANGLVEWKTKLGESLKSIESNKN